MAVNIVFVAIILIVVLFTVLIGWRWLAKRQKARKKNAELLSRRCTRLFDVLNVIPDRYIPKQTKSIVLNYLEESLQTILAVSPTPEQQNKLLEVEGLKQEHEMSARTTSQETIQTELQLNQVKDSLQILLTFIKGLARQRKLDKAAAAYQLEQLRYLLCRAKADLLSRKALEDLDAGKKARALAKYQSALDEMNKVDSVVDARRDIVKLKQRVQMLEEQLLDKRKLDSQGH